MMAGTINYLYDPNQSVYVIDTLCDTPTTAVRAGIVIRIRAEELVTISKLFYDVQVDGQSGTTEFVEADVFTDLATAIAEYEIRLTP